MSRTVSLTLRQAINAQQSGEVAFLLLTITHPDIDETLRFSGDPTTRLSIDPLLYGTVSRGNTFYFVPFSTVLPDDKDESPPQAQLTLDNVNRDTIALLRSTDTPASVTMELVLVTNPDTVEVIYPVLDLVAATYTAQSVTMTLQIEPLMTEPFPAGIFDPASFPALF